MVTKPENLEIEFRIGFAPRPRIRHVVFDFDGTLSLVRGGWCEIMLTMYCELLPATPQDDALALRQTLLHHIMSLNGQPSIQQMIRLRELVLKRGFPALAAEAYHDQFQNLLSVRRTQRIQAIVDQTSPADRYLIPGARTMLRLLDERGMVLHLVSGTEERAVREEAAHLGISAFFSGRIHGPSNNSAPFSKGAEIDRIVREHGLAGDELLSFGDGPVEIRETRRVGGLAVAVASVEADPAPGGIDPDKRALLLSVGADAVIGDYTQAPRVLQALGFPPAGNTRDTTGT